MVVGDVCLDEYIIGKAQRLSREAPVPILEFQRRFTIPGAAANPALNVKAMGGEAFIVSAIGDDEIGWRLTRRLMELGIDSRGMVVDSSRHTTVKTRVVSEMSLRFPQQIVRVDLQDRAGIMPSIRKKILAHIREIAPLVDAVLISDYRSGVIDQRIINACSETAKAHDKVLTVDSQGDLFQFKGFTVVKSNQHEAEIALRMELTDGDSFQRAGRLLQKRLDAAAVLVTRGSDGMSLVENDGSCHHIPVVNRSEVFDVTGAGDTVIATLTMALVAGANVLEAAHLANYAAGLVVRRLGNVTITQEELLQAILGKP